MRRCNEALDAGADIAFLEAPQTIDEVRAVPEKDSGPCLLNVVRGGKTPEVTFQQAKKVGYSIVIVPGLLMLQTIGACDWH